MRMLLTMLVAALSVTVAATGCNPPQSAPDWPWEEPDPGTGGGDSSAVKPRYVWIDASANFSRYANSRENIADDMKRIAKMGFTDVIVDVRPSEGTVLFHSVKAPAATWLAAWVGGKYGKVERTADFDYIQAFIDAGKSAGVRVNAAINTFVCGYRGLYGVPDNGPIFSGDIDASWACMDYKDGNVVSSYTANVGDAVFMNPVNQDVRAYMLDLIGELAAYDLNGIILDRCRFDDTNLGCEFSDLTRGAFEAFSGSAVANWPADVIPATDAAGYISGTPTTLQKKWLSFRAKTIHDFVEAAAGKVHSKNPKIRFGCYVGAWYSTYYLSGVNWASPRYNTSLHYDWAGNDYASYGYADHCDFMMLGCYAAANSIEGSGEWTIQGFCRQGKTLLCGDTEFAGGPDIGNPDGWNRGGCGDRIPKVVEVCLNEADGLFVFDLCHIRANDYWSAFEKGIGDYLKK
ncbi:MAG: family 10 glycosylhydrolase [Bacteroidales bacterium]|nr:family 10 glycosylhydrolase [Bacteroidales bacterium]